MKQPFNPRDLESFVSDIEDPPQFAQAWAEIVDENFQEKIDGVDGQDLIIEYEAYYNRFREDPIIFQETFCSVPSAKGMVDYIADEYQVDIARDKHELVAVNKSRQTGISVQTVLDKSHAGIFNPAYLCTFISLRQLQANELIYKQGLMIDAMEGWKIPVISSQASSRRFANGARYQALSANPSAARGFSGDLVLDEFAIVPNDREIMTAALATTVLEGYNIRMISTPYGDRGEFARIVQGIKAGEITDWGYHEIHWTKCKRLKYERIRPRCNTPEDFEQEYCCVFIDETTSMISLEMLTRATPAEAALEQWSLNYPVISKGKVFIGVDPATKVNETGLIVTELIDNKWYIRHVYNSKLEPDAIMKLVEDWIKHVKPTRVYMDATGAGYPIYQLMTKKLGGGYLEEMQMMNKLKERLVYNMTGIFESNNIYIPDHRVLKDQLHALERGRTETGMYYFTGKVKGQQDDLTWATTLALTYQMSVSPNLDPDIIKLKRKRKSTRGYRRRVYR